MYWWAARSSCWWFYSHWGGQRLIKARLGKDRLEACHEVGGYYMAAVGTLYAVILGLAVSEASNQYDEAMHYLETEANGLLQVYYLSATFPEYHQKQIQQSIGRYADEVTQVEWDKMRTGGYSEKAKLFLATLMYDIVTLEPATQQQQTTYDRMLDSMTEVSASRRGRVLITDYGMQPLNGFRCSSGAVSRSCSPCPSASRTIRCNR